MEVNSLYLVILRHGLLLRDENGDLLPFEDEDGYPFSLPVWKSRSFVDIIAAN